MTDAPALATLPDADEDATAGLARVLAAVLGPGDCLLLDGPVGAGKSHFARALIRARQGDAAEDVPSPTFTLVQTYEAAVTEIWHADLYRLTDPSELVELGLDEAIDTAITLIEWPDRMGAPPPGALTVSLRPTAPDRRRITLSGDPARWPGVARLAEIAAFLHRAGRAGARVAPLAGDASARRYFRLTGGDGTGEDGTGGDGTAVLMDAPPGTCAPYLAMTGWLRDRGFHAPQVLAADAAAGLLLLEDLGDDLVARVLDRDPDAAPAIYARLADLIADLHRHAPPDFVPALDGPALAEQVGLFAQWYPPAAGVPGAGAGVAAAVAALYAQLCADAAPALSLRDFHAENVVWRGGAAPGLLDFQDAVATHPAYDLASALQDARRDVAPDIEAAALARYLAATGQEPGRFAAAYALMGAQRGLRIMGIFTRLCLRDAKPRYLAFMPRVWAAIVRDVAHPALAPLAAALRGVPPPTPEIIERIAARCGTRPTR
ncbi:tRNA (adenosine(37)-N6)-threonylcarbamoyltransferase complex ATPase subunit type 1 TsaE [Paracoccus luteus]|uniref:tRNA (adenosine(37)-N6)-threonylcarbamoyltransferase complex ATPase subunit type 1 TsaE n=1 Tax=Paracoccus luteus TaxID=2508543 RepID=UPI001070286F|nr:tRNA (adenosine(37)-N6)-threonylcarbamoyltransferase complex ATPase subunit type 1 TsaE [Paracoccus luteus]